MNINKLQKLIDDGKFSKSYIVKKSDITRPTLDSILEGNDCRVSVLEKIGNAINKPVSWFFDETPAAVHTEGDLSPASGSGDVEVIVGDAVLMERVKSLNTLIAEKDERIAELKERIEELKNK